MGRPHWYACPGFSFDELVGRSPLLRQAWLAQPRGRCSGPVWFKGKSRESQRNRFLRKGDEAWRLVRRNEQFHSGGKGAGDAQNGGTKKSTPIQGNRRSLGVGSWRGFAPRAGKELKAAARLSGGRRSRWLWWHRREPATSPRMERGAESAASPKRGRPAAWPKEDKRAESEASAEAGRAGDVVASRRRPARDGRHAPETRVRADRRAGAAASPRAEGGRGTGGLGRQAGGAAGLGGRGRAQQGAACGEESVVG